jgi:hypothetical protein
MAQRIASPAGRQRSDAQRQRECRDTDGEKSPTATIRVFQKLGEREARRPPFSLRDRNRSSSEGEDASQLRTQHEFSF